MHNGATGPGTHLIGGGDKGSVGEPQTSARLRDFYMLPARPGDSVDTMVPHGIDGVGGHDGLFRGSVGS